MKPSGGALAVGVLFLAGLGLTAMDGLPTAEVIALLALGSAGVMVAAVWPRAADLGAWVADRMDEALGRSRPAAPDVDTGPNAAERAVRDVLATLAEQLGARRMTVWRLDRHTDTLTPEHVLGEPPGPQPAAGSPLAWVVEEWTSLRLDPAPGWAGGRVVAAPVDGLRALSAETPPDMVLEPERLEPGGRILGALLTLVDREVDARRERERVRDTVAFLRELSGDTDPGRVPASLASAAIELVGGTGAVVAAWDGDGRTGTVLASAGSDGPDPGRTFGARDGDLAHAGRTGSTIRRAPEAGDRPPLTAPDERWSRTPPYRVVVPLVGIDGTTGGLVAVWGDWPPAEQGVTLLEALGPILALYIRQATDLVRFRDRATADALTGLPNRAAFEDRLEREQTRFHRYRRPVALMVVDLDRFKAVNDTHGHEAGDAVLRAVGGVIREAVRDADIAARYGGEELVVLMPETMLRAAEDVAERVRAAIAGADVTHAGTRIPVTASIGLSGCPESVDEPRGLFDAADRALYQAKAGGRNRVVVARRAAPG